MNRFKNVLVGSAVSVLMFTLAVPPASAQSSTMINLQAQIAALTAQIVAMTGGVTNQAEYVASDKIITTSAVRVRTIGSLNGVVLGSQRNGSLGTIVAGPVRASNNTWYRINFDVGIDGWVAAANFERNGLQNKPEVGFSRSGSDLEKLLALATEAPQVRYDLPKTKTAFVQYLYRCVLDRVPFEGEIMNWVNATRTVSAMYTGFLNSAEFTKKNLNNPQFVDKLYQCVLFREAEQAGKNGWVARLAAGDSRVSVLNRFMASTEYNSKIKLTLDKLVQTTLTQPTIPPVTPLPPTPPVATLQNPNLGKIQTRFIVVNIPETQSPINSLQLNEASTSLLNLKNFVKKSSYGNTSLVGNISGIFKIQPGSCNQSTFQENVNYLLQRSLEAADKQQKLPNYSHFIIYHPTPDCPDGITWSAEGYGTFKEYTLNGRAVYLRGVRTPDISNVILFHEFGHSLGSIPEKMVGHPDYLKCNTRNPSPTSTVILINKNCTTEYDFNSGILPIYDVMSGNQNVGLSDFGSITKLNIGWINNSNLKHITSNGTYKLVSFENNAIGTKVLSLNVTASTTAYFSFRQPIKYSTITKPGVVVEVISSEKYSYPHHSFLVLNHNNYQQMMIPGIIYTIGLKKISLKSLTNGSVEVDVK